MKGISVSVLREEGKDCTNGGVSSKGSRFILVGEGMPELFESNENAPALRLVKRIIGGKPYYHAEPFDRPSDSTGPMAGGNFIYSYDSRFRTICQYPIAIHDRFEKG